MRTILKKFYFANPNLTHERHNFTNSLFLKDFNRFIPSLNCGHKRRFGLAFGLILATSTPLVSTQGHGNHGGNNLAISPCVARQFSLNLLNAMERNAGSFPLATSSRNSELSLSPGNEGIKESVRIAEWAHRVFQVAFEEILQSPMLSAEHSAAGSSQVCVIPEQDKTSLRKLFVSKSRKNKTKQIAQKNLGQVFGSSAN